MLVIASDISKVLNLPWEIVQPPDGEVLGLDPAFSIMRLPGQLEALPQFKGQLPPGPLRVVFAACSPRQSIDYLREEESFAKALEGLDVAWDSCDLGTYKELKKRVDKFGPQIVHLVGQEVVKDGHSYFAFEGDSGLADLRSSGDIEKALPGVQLLLLSGCQGKNPSILANLGIELVKADIAMAMIWPGSIADGESAIRAFYEDLASGNTLFSAIASMRREIGDVNKKGTVLFAFPTLYSRTDQDRTFDPKQRSVLPWPHMVRQPPLKSMTEGYSENFVGRRRDLQRLVPALREGRVKTVVITGPVGSGKSTLAVRLAEELESAGFSIVAVSSSRENPLSTARLIDVLVGAFHEAAAKRLALGRNDLAEGIVAASQALKNSSDERLEKAVEALNLGQFLIFLDDFDPNLDESGLIKDPEVAQFYMQLLSNLSGSRAIITSVRLPRNATTLPQKVWEQAIGALTKADLFRFLQRDGDLAARLRSGELSYEMLGQICERTNRLPLCLDRITRALRAKNPADLTALALSGSQLSRSFCDEITSWLYCSLNPVSRRLLCRASVHTVPLNLAELEFVTGVPQERIKGLSEEWNEKALAFSTDDGLVIRKELRDWLTIKLSKEEIRAAHEVAGDFFNEVVKEKTYKRHGLTSLERSLIARVHFLAAGDGEKAREVTSRISSTMMARGLYAEILALNQELLKLSEHPTPIRWIAQALLEQGDFQNAREWYQRIIQSPGRSEEDAAASWQGIASMELSQGRYDKAEEYLNKALDVYRQKGDERRQAGILRDLASTEMAKGDYAQAKENLNIALKIQKKTKDLAAQASALKDLIAIDLLQKDRKAAREMLGESLEIFKKLGAPSGEAATIYDLASLDMENEDFDSAIEKFRMVLEIRRRIGDRAGEAATLHNLAMIDAHKGNVQVASEKFKEALKIYQQTGDKSGEAAAFFQLGILAIRLGHTSEGMRLLALSGILLKSIGSGEVRNVEPVIERMATQMKYTQDQFAEMVREAARAYRKERGWGLVEAVLGTKDGKN